MTLLSALILKRKIRNAATAIPAISATQPKEGAGTVARIATVAIATPTEAKTANAATSWGWSLHFADRDPLEAYCNPDATHAEILERYPESLATEPITVPECTRRPPTEAEAEELRALVQAIGGAEKWTADEIEWATAGVMADPDGALACYRALVVVHGIILPLDDDRRTCNQCANLVRLRCLAAWRGEIVANRDYAPIRDIPRRCEGYMSVADDPDKRPGCERWPELIHKGDK